MPVGEFIITALYLLLKIKVNMIKKYFIFLFFFLIACKSKTQLAINDNYKLISQAQDNIQEIKIEAKQCNNQTLDLKVNVLEKQLETLKYNNEKVELLYVAEIKQYKIYKYIVSSCFILGCLFMATKISLLKLK